MRYSQIVETYQELEKTTKKLEKRDILAELYKKCSVEMLARVVNLSMGIIVSKEQDLGIAREMIKRIISKAYGIDKKYVIRVFKETGDLGLTAEWFAKHRKQHALAKKELTVDHVFDSLQKLPEITGQGSQDRKVNLVVELLTHANPDEARYIVRTIIGDMRIGVAYGIVRDAIAKAFNQDSKEIERAWHLTADFGHVAEMAKRGKVKAEIILFRPMQVMLADRAPNLKTALEAFEHVAIETKYDGFRVEIHKGGDKIKVFSRRLEDVTHQFPDIVSWAKNQLKPKECIVDGEAVAINVKTGETLPFQRLSKRIQRKYDIEKMVKEIPVRVNIFDLIYFDKESWMGKPLKERWHKLQRIIKESKNFGLAEHVETKDLKKALEFYQGVLKRGQEGVIIKNMDAHYQPGRRVGYWLKVKEILEPLDLVVVGAEWGEGKRAKWLGSLILAARSGEEFLETGRIASGLTEEQLDQLTKTLKPLITEDYGKIVRIKPEVVIEVGYEEIQKSPKYPTGYALRFPRLLRIRDPADKGPQDANTVKDIKKLFLMQRGRGRKKGK